MYRRWYSKISWVLLAAALVLILLGFVIIYSATFRDEKFSDTGRQMLAFLFGLCLSVFVFLVDYKRLCTYKIPLGFSGFGIRLSYVYYAATVLLLLFVLKGGHSSHGAQRWIRLGPLGTFQPSE